LGFSAAVMEEEEATLVEAAEAEASEGVELLAVSILAEAASIPVPSAVSNPAASIPVSRPGVSAPVDSLNRRR
jgi:hypothetical protein